MKKILFISITLILVILSCKKTPEDIIVNPSFIGKNQLWSEGTASPDFITNKLVPGWSEYYKLGKDTLIEGQNWTFLLSTMDENKTNWQNYGFIRENNHKVYRKEPVPPYDEFLLYDFSIKQGDTIKFGSYNFIVSSVKYESLPNHTKRKYFYISPTDYPGEVVWIDGIGSITGFLDNLGDNSTVVGGPSILLCYYEDNVLVYKDTKYGFNTCFFLHK